MCVCVQFDIDENLVSLIPISLRTNKTIQYTTQNFGMYMSNVPWCLCLVHKYFCTIFSLRRHATCVERCNTPCRAQSTCMFNLRCSVSNELVIKIGEYVTILSDF